MVGVGGNKKDWHGDEYHGTVFFIQYLIDWSSMSTPSTPSPLTPEQEDEILDIVMKGKDVTVIDLGLTSEKPGGGLLLMPVLLPVKLWRLVLVGFKRVSQISPSCSEVTRTLKDASINRVIPAKAGIGF
jgi:hypothetical protein